MSKNKSPRQKPFIKWVGGKSQLLTELEGRVPKRYHHYFEPFLGGGALFFKLWPTRATLSDINEELIRSYRAVQSDVSSVIKELKKLPHSEEVFYETRNIDRCAEFLKWPDVRRAARLIYLNKTCFNGLYRVNSKGQFNVPFGRYSKPTIVDEENLRFCSRLLSKAQIECSEFLSVEEKARAGDFIYFDPPYAPLSNTSNFTGYARAGFNDQNQRGLRDLCRRLDKKGVQWMLSNSSAPLILDLYKSFYMEFVSASRAINSKAAGRGKITEVIIRNYE